MGIKVMRLWRGKNYIPPPYGGIERRIV